MTSKASTVEQYLAGLPPDRRAALQTVRDVILKNLGAGYEEGMQYGMIGYYVPHSLYPAGYHCDPKQPLCFAGLASQKNYMTLHLMSLYGSAEQEAWFRRAWAQAGKKLDMGKSCIRFKRAEDLALDVIGESIRRVPVDAYIRACEAALQSKDRATRSSTVEGRGAARAGAKSDGRNAAATRARPTGSKRSRPSASKRPAGRRAAGKR